MDTRSHIRLEEEIAAGRARMRPVGAAFVCRMKPYRLANQYLFHTGNAFRFLLFLESVEVAR